ncbi:MAG: efflux RND transporter periplasmic adaptor subunit [Nitrosomonadales bacterium]|nr:efflux RND transporter periplasmic adaptor subunit [Nitrosomonadales bacterium]
MSQTGIPARNNRGKPIVVAAVLFAALGAGVWAWLAQKSPANARGAGPLQVVSAQVGQTDVPVKLTTDGTVTAVQTVEIRPQINATIRAVHIREGQFVRKGERLFSLDARTEEANLNKATAQVDKDRADLANAERNLERQRELLRQEYISRSEFDTAQNAVDGLRNQLAADQAAVEASRVARSFNEIAAPISGRSGAIAVYPGSLVQTSGAALVSIAQVDPIDVSFTLPERELAGLQQSLAKGAVPVSAKPDATGEESIKGRLIFIDNAVDTASGTIRLKAEFPNAAHRLWPGMFVTVALEPRILVDALTVPAQAVQTGPENKFVYVIAEDSKVAAVPVKLRLIQDGRAVIEGAASGARVVVEGAQNLRPGSVVAEAEKKPKVEDRQGKGSGKPDGAGKQ